MINEEGEEGLMGSYGPNESGYIHNLVKTTSDLLDIE